MKLTLIRGTKPPTDSAKFDLPGLCLVVTLDRNWGGIYLFVGYTVRICLGWLALTFVPVSGDSILLRAGAYNLPKECLE